MKKKILITIFLLVALITSGKNCYVSAYSGEKLIQTSIVLQNWKIDKVKDGISEVTFPIQIILPFSDKGNLQIFHSPAVSRYGNIELNGFSDTWFKSAYYISEQLLITGGIGLPTGKTDIKENESMLSTFLTKDVFKFQLPVFGQGFSLNAGLAYARPINNNFVAGCGINFIYQGDYNYLDYEYDPGNQISMNLGVDYNLTTNLTYGFDFIYRIYSDDKINEVIYTVNPKIIIKSGIQYVRKNTRLDISGRIRINNRNETSYGTTVLIDSTSSNVTQMELEAKYLIQFAHYYSVEFLFDGRSYIENKFQNGQADIFGGGVRSTIDLTPKFQISFSLMHYGGESNLNYSSFLHKVSGVEFKLMTVIRY